MRLYAFVTFVLSHSIYAPIYIFARISKDQMEKLPHCRLSINLRMISWCSFWILWIPVPDIIDTHLEHSARSLYRKTLISHLTFARSDTYNGRKRTDLILSVYCVLTVCSTVKIPRNDASSKTMKIRGNGASRQRKFWEMMRHK